MSDIFYTVVKAKRKTIDEKRTFSDDSSKITGLMSTIFGNGLEPSFSALRIMVECWRCFQIRWMP